MIAQYFNEISRNGQEHFTIGCSVSSLRCLRLFHSHPYLRRTVFVEPANRTLHAAMTHVLQIELYSTSCKFENAMDWSLLHYNLPVIWGLGLGQLNHVSQTTHSCETFAQPKMKDLPAADVDNQCVRTWSGLTNVSISRSSCTTFDLTKLTQHLTWRS